MKSIVTTIAVVMVLAGNATHAADYVQRALTTCGHVNGTSRYFPCMQDAANSLCRPLPMQESASCFGDFERYHRAEADRLDRERKTLREDTERRIERLQAVQRGGR